MELSDRAMLAATSLADAPLTDVAFCVALDAWTTQRCSRCLSEALEATDDALDQFTFYVATPACCDFQRLAHAVVHNYVYRAIVARAVGGPDA